MTIIPVFVKPKRRIRRVFIHCSASDLPEHDDVAVIRKWHLERGFRDVGYHYYIQKNGNVQTGRDIAITPAGQIGHNTGSIALCLGGLDADKFTTAQFRSLYALCDQIRNCLPDVTFHGHCEVSKKKCPVFNYKNILLLDSKGCMA